MDPIANMITSLKNAGNSGLETVSVPFSKVKQALVKGVKRISKSSKRIYLKSGEIKAVKNGYGALIISTPQGIMTGRDAKKSKLGGEALFSIW